jgi:hypothetical protein
VCNQIRPPRVFISDASTRRKELLTRHRDSPTRHREPPEIDTDVPRSARVYNYFLGGTDNFAVDREAAERVAALRGGWGKAGTGPRAQRAFLGRAIRYLAGEGGVRQVLDIGCGIPADDHTHEVAQRVAPDARVVYVDRDPVVTRHVRSLLAALPADGTVYLEADLRDPEGILEHAATTLDLTQPVAIMLLGILHHIEAQDDPWGTVRRLMDCVSSGSYVAVSQVASDIQKEMVPLADQYSGDLFEALIPRSRAEVCRFFDDLELVEPGVVPIQLWRPDDPQATPEPARLAPAYAGVARKP